jgi:hypothetical protein
MGIKSLGSSGEREETLELLKLSKVTLWLSISWRGARSEREGANLADGCPRLDELAISCLARIPAK